MPELGSFEDFSKNERLMKPEFSALADLRFEDIEMLAKSVKTGEFHDSSNDVTKNTLLNDLKTIESALGTADDTYSEEYKKQLEVLRDKIKSALETGESTN